MYSNEIVTEILDYIDANINKKITVLQIAQALSFNKDYIMRIFKREIHKTIVDYINRKRVYASLRELEKTDDSILKVAINNGFYSQEYFSEVFFKVLQVTPTTYRKFTRINSNISEEQLKTIRKTLAILFEDMKMVEEYIRNRKHNDRKVLSLFSKKTII